MTSYSPARTHAQRTHTHARYLNIPLGINYEIRNPPTKVLPEIVRRFALQSEARELLPDERVSTCLRSRQSRMNPVDVCYVSEVKAAHYGNLVVCGSIWHCPVCSAKIATRRVEEMAEGIANWEGGTLMMTFTLKHHAGESCSYVLSGLLAAHRKFWRGSPAKRFKERYGIKGKIRSLEVTHGLNGWHAHIHELLFVKNPGFVFLDDMQAYAVNRWRDVLARQDRYASVENGLDIRAGNDFIAEYVTKIGRLPKQKWTEAHELGHSHRKRSRAWVGKSPIQLLEASLHGDSRAGELWIEYARAFKGKRQLSWSPGLRELLGLSLEEQSDQEIAEYQDQSAEVLASLDKHHWITVIRNDIRAELLQVASRGSVVAVKQFLEEFGIYGVQYPEDYLISVSQDSGYG